MTFLAIVHAPALRPGARLSLCDLGQTVDRPPERISPGAPVDLRFGTCCPDLACGAIGLCDTDAEEAVLRVADAEWRIRRSNVGTRTPGMISEEWIVLGV